MKPIHLLPCVGGIVAASVFAAVAGANDDAKPKAASPIYGVTIPDKYRQWELVAPAEEAEPLNELRAVLGNVVAMKAYREGTLPFPDGTILAKLAWKHVQSPEFESASIPGAATTVQIMVKDSKKYAATGGWGFGRFVDGKPADEAQHETCFACHEARVQGHDYVFTRYAH
ncbi:cytochrome C oxidase subunit III [Mesorhizobium sp. M00.F.Ca.ET.186.01.1.1]|nr:cytochrome C oxidase subunit III [bacterium M00.F.Ca.ET.205.01.1.1]TGU52308.1 cytochrome C oxidase subunit III [bacterium M00.F.Ca.ET.152.01.1.1]TGV35014.1 cytochrome C oxidase subunit III [Mesorhizobium sp. M00.F.Ca.ET.186.01.1.1]TGZ42968.1 cytochrome C oxidase subunit III [bacterium M00.F.Ca.ET.162.01.1.1]